MHDFFLGFQDCWLLTLCAPCSFLYIPLLLHIIELIRSYINFWLNVFFQSHCNIIKGEKKPTISGLDVEFPPWALLWNSRTKHKPIRGEGLAFMLKMMTSKPWWKIWVLKVSGKLWNNFWWRQPKVHYLLSIIHS